MSTLVSVILACLFVFLAAFNVWIMLTNRGASPRSCQLWTQAHRVSGYAFIALLVIFLYFMLLRVKGSPDELSPRLILHMGLALALAPLLFAKVIVVRHQKDAWNLLMTLGIAILAIAFTVVALNVSIHFLRDASTRKVPAGISRGIIVIALVSASIGFLSGIKKHKPEARKEVSSIQQG